MSYYVPKQLLNIDANPKTSKGSAYGYLTGVLYLAPHTLSGSNLCPMADVAGCSEACLNTAGNPAYAQTKQKGRLNKTMYYLKDKQAFMLHLVRDIQALKRKALRLGFVPVVRLNGTSDIQWEKVTFDYEGKRTTIFEVFKDVQFYDYTKIPSRKDLPSNYDLTFSYSGTLKYQRYCDQAIESGLRVAVVFRKNLPERFKGLDVINGDAHDLRFTEPLGVAIGLIAKGKAKKDYSGFVVDSGLGTIEITKG